MGVISERGVIGIVKETSKRYSTVLSILHSQSKLSVAIKKTTILVLYNGMAKAIKKLVYDVSHHM